MSAFGFGPSIRYACAGQGTTDETRLELYRQLYDGDRAATIEAVRVRYIAADLSSEREYDESRRNFAILNELRSIVDRRIDAMPDGFEIAHDEDEALAVAAQEWADGRVTNRGLPLSGAYTQAICDQERDGNAAIVLGRSGEQVTATIRDTAQMQLETDALSGAVRLVRFTWAEDVPGEGRRSYVHELTDTASVLQAGEQREELEHGFGFLPVVLIPREVIHGSPIGRSGVQDLIEAYLHFLWSAYLMNTANKYEGFGVYCPQGAHDDGAFLADDTGAQMTAFRISPGCLYPIPIEKVGGSISIQSILEQYREAKSTLYKLGKVKQDRGQGADLRSGKAMLIDTHELRDYVARKLALVKIGFERVLDMWAWLTGAVESGQPSGLKVVFPPLDDDDPAEQTKRGDLMLKAAVAGKLDGLTFLKGWKSLGLLGPDVDAEALAGEMDAKAEEEAEARMTQMAAMLEQRQSEREQPEDDDDAEEMADA